MASKRKQLRDIYAALDAAESYQDWLDAATAHDEVTGAAEWRCEDESHCYDAAALRQAILRMVRLREASEGAGLIAALNEDLQRNLDDLCDPTLYDDALAGSKLLVERYLDEVEVALDWLVDADLPGINDRMRLDRFEAAWRVYGRSALLLSGGATLGFHHLGVVKALMKQGLLPDILSGASTGAMIAAGVCTRNDAELANMFADTDQIRLDGLAPVGVIDSLRSGSWLDPDQLYDVLQHNVGDRTFAEAHAHSGRALNISVSPTRTRQKPRLLTHLTAPDVLVARAALASSALPGLFPPVELEAKDSKGQIVRYIPGERWVDGSLRGDLPKQRLARLHNVNHFIVSQTNPHVLPFVRHHSRRGLRPAVAGLVGATVRTQVAYGTELARRATQTSGPVGTLAEQAHALVSQDYRGDIDIHPQFHWALYRKVVSNPTRDDLTSFIREGERSVWPRVAMIRDQTRVDRVFRRCVARLRGRLTAR